MSKFRCLLGSSLLKLYVYCTTELMPDNRPARNRRMAWEIAKNGPVAIRAAKEAIDTGLEAQDMINALFIERRCYQRTVPTEDRLEGLAAFREGRPPVYKGK